MAYINYMKKTEVIYFTFEGLFSNAFDSQVLTLSSRLINDNKPEFNFRLVIFSPAGHILKKRYWLKRDNIKKILLNHCFFSYRFPFLYRFPQLMKTSLFLNSLICFFVLFFILKIKKSEKLIFHGRGQAAGYILLKLKRIFYRNVAVFSDIRSIASVEALHYYPVEKNRVKLAKKLEEIEDFIENKSDYLSCVSHTFKSYILHKHKNKTLNITVTPNCVDVYKFYYDPRKRKSSREKMGIDNKFVVIYSGSLQENKQLPERMIDIYKIIKNTIGDSVFLVLTNSEKYAEKLFSESNLDRNDYIILNKPYSILNDYLIAGDIGLIILSDDKNSNVARPIKFAEYLRSGVPVLINGSLHDISKSVKKHDFGFEINDCFNNAEVKEIALNLKNKLDFIRSDEYKKVISRLVSEEMNWDYYLKLIWGIYTELSLKLICTI